MKSLIIFILLNCSSLCFSLENKYYEQLATVLIENQISIGTVLQFLSEINDPPNEEVKSDDEDSKFHLSKESFEFVKNTVLFVLKCYKNNKKLLSYNLKSSLEDKNMNDIKLQIVVGLCEKITDLLGQV
jgi:hypothetical protein